MNGFLLIDKPQGLSSFDVVRRVRGMLKAKKAGHCGTLDPLATGLLVVCLNKATRLAQYVLGQDKVYEVRIKLGQTSDTYDRTGNLSDEEAVSHLTREKLEGSLAGFRGEITQQPPKFSALKVDGRAMYKYAREGVEVEVPERQVAIHELRILKFELPYVELLVRCSKGTYVRSLAHDLGERLGCGAHVDELRRTAIGDISVEEALSLDELQEKDDREGCVIPIEKMLGLPAIVIQPAKAAAIRSGVEIRANDIVDSEAPIDADQLVALRNGDGNLLAVGRSLFDSAEFANLGQAKVIEYVRVM